MTLTTPSTSVAGATTIPAPTSTLDAATSAGVASAPTSMSSAATTPQSAEGNCFSSICDCIASAISSVFHFLTCGCFRGQDTAAITNENVQFHERLNGLRNIENRPLEHADAFIQLYKDAPQRHKETTVNAYQTYMFNKLATAFNAEEQAALQGRFVTDFAQFRQGLIASKHFANTLSPNSSAVEQLQAAAIGRPMSDVKNAFNDYFAQLFYRHQTNAGSRDALVGEMRQLTQAYWEIAIAR